MEGEKGLNHCERSNNIGRNEAHCAVEQDQVKQKSPTDTVNELLKETEHFRHENKVLRQENVKLAQEKEELRCENMRLKASIAGINIAQESNPSSNLVPTENRIKEGVVKFLNNEITTLNLYKNYQEWYADISNRVKSDIPLIYSEFIVVKHSSEEKNTNGANFAYNIKTSGSTFFVRKNGDFWLHKEGKLFILHPKEPLQAMGMTKTRSDEENECHEWKSSLPDGLYREEGDAKIYSMLAIGTKKDDAHSAKKESDKASEVENEKKSKWKRFSGKGK
eukprot:TCONS_00036156-protein